MSDSWSPVSGPAEDEGAATAVRAAVLGLAAGGRSTLGLAGPVLSARELPGSPATGALLRVGAAVAALGEMVGDKLPQVPSRTAAPVLAGRILLGAVGGGSLAHRDGVRARLSLLAGALGALGGSYGGAAWRRWAGRRMPDRRAALVEDALAIALAAAACLPRRPEPREDVPTTR